MKLFKQIKTNLHTGCIKTKYIFGIPCIVTETIFDKNGSKRKRHFSPFLKKYASNNIENPFETVFYLKVNRCEHFAFVSLQQWINIINELNADFYIVCDKKEVKEKILEKIVFKNSNIKFIKSAKNKLKNIVKNIATPCWENATYAQLTTFLHADKNGMKSFYNIDADDTMFVCESKKAAQILLEAKKYADKNNIKAFSFDMHVTQFRNQHWSFGITYTRTDFNWMKLFNSNKDKKWQDIYIKNHNEQFNLDWFMTYLKTIYNDKIQTFYVENLLFIHWATLFCLHIGYSVQRTFNGYTLYPLFDYFNTDKQLSKVKIPAQVIKLDIGLTEKDCMEYGRYNVVNEKYASNVVNWWNSWK